MTTKAPRSIVRCADYNGCKDVLFMMDHDDFRFGTANYQPVTGGKYVPKFKMFEGTNGLSYNVFPDWSARLAA